MPEPGLVRNAHLAFGDDGALSIECQIGARRWSLSIPRVADDETPLIVVVADQVETIVPIGIKTIVESLTRFIDETSALNTTQETGER